MEDPNTLEFQFQSDSQKSVRIRHANPSCSKNQSNTHPINAPSAISVENLTKSRRDITGTPFTGLNEAVNEDDRKVKNCLTLPLFVKDSGSVTRLSVKASTTWLSVLIAALAKLSLLFWRYISTQSYNEACKDNKETRRECAFFIVRSTISKEECASTNS